MKRATGPASGIALVAVLPSPANAHLVGVEFGDFYAGVLHLIVAPEHVAILVGLALVAAFQPIQSARFTLLSLPLGFLLGTIAGSLTGVETGLNSAIAATLCVTGGLGAAAIRLPGIATTFLAGLIGVVHGYANGAPVQGTAVDWWLYSGGVIVIGTVLGTLAIAAARALATERTWMPITYRVLSSWIAAIGLMSFSMQMLV